MADVLKSDSQRTRQTPLEGHNRQISITSGRPSHKRLISFYCQIEGRRGKKRERKYITLRYLVSRQPVLEEQFSGQLAPVVGFSRKLR